MTLNCEIPEQYFELFKPARFKTFYGGRYGAKDWSYCRALLWLGALHNPKITKEKAEDQGKKIASEFGIDPALIINCILYSQRILCAREVQKSIKESVWMLLKEQIKMMGLESFYKVNDKGIEGRNGTTFFFEGLYRNVHNIKSIEGVTICAVFEAEAVSDESWKDLIPTIRKEGSEIWVSFNTKYVDDPTYVRMVRDAPKDSIVRFINSFDVEQYMTQTAKDDRERDYALRPQEAKNIWGGEPIGYGRLIWQDYKEDVHTREFNVAELAKRNDVEWYSVIDPAQHYYPASFSMARWPKDKGKNYYHWIYAEYPSVDDLGEFFYVVRKSVICSKSLGDLATAIKISEGANEHGIKMVSRFIDSRYASGTGSWSQLTQGLLKEWAKPENGNMVFLCPPTKFIDSAKNEVRRLMQWDTTRPIGVFNEPDLFISAKCKNVHDSLKNHRLEEDSEKESEKRKDFSDCLKIMFAGLQAPREVIETEEDEFAGIVETGGSSWMH